MSSKIKAGTASSGAVIDADTTGILELQTGSTPTTAVTIDASQNVGIGTSNPAGKRLYVLGGGAVIDQASVSGATLILNRSSNPGSIAFQYNSTETGQIQAISGGGLSFFTGSSPTERMRITSAGSLLVGTTAPISAGFTTISYDGTALNGLVISESANSSGTAFLAFNNGATNIGSISRVGATSAVQYSTTSDQRLKSNIADANPVLDKLMDVKVRQFDWTEGDLHQDAGFIAQELAPVLSGIVTEGKTTEDMWQVDYSRLTPYLVKAIQELNAKLDAQAAEIATLRGNA